MHEQEIVRLRGEYNRRARAYPSDYYGLSNPANLYFRQITARRAIDVLRRVGQFPLNGKRILDVGCGSGAWLVDFVHWGASPQLMAGVDLSRERIEAARGRFPEADLRTGHADQLDWPDNTFDLVSQFTVFTSILDRGLRRDAARDMFRVLKPGGVVLWYDFRVNNPSNDNVLAVSEGEIQALFPAGLVHLDSTTLLPPLARKVVPFSWTLASILELVPVLRTHYLGIIQKPA